MKKVFCLLTALLLLGGACACGAKPQAATITEGYARLLGFESYGEFMAVRQVEYFGRYSLNVDPAYIRKGKSSVKLEISGAGYGGDRPGLKISPDVIADGREDFSRAERIVFDIYNAESTVQACYFSAQFATSGNPQSTREATYYLAPGAWTKCVYDIDYERLCYVYDFSRCTGLLLSFNGVKTGEKMPVFYLDELLVKEQASPRTPPAIELDENEICDFEKPYQEYITYISGFDAYEAYIPDVTINTDPKYVSRGNKSLKLRIPHGNANATCWVRLLFAESLVKKLDLAGLGTAYDIVFDLYNDSDSAFTVLSSLRGTDIKLEKAFSTAPRVWTECRLSLAELAEKYPSKEGEPSVLEAIGSFEITYGNFVGYGPEDDKDLYVDNIRFEKVR